MRRLSAIMIFVSFLIIVMIGCETDRILFQGPYFVRFTDTTETKLESYSQQIQIEIHNAGPLLDEDLDVTYSISGTARENVDYKIIGTRGKVVIPKGKYAGYLTLQLINNANNILRSQYVTFTLTGTDNSDRQTGEGESGLGKRFTFTINDDCILGGTYQGERDSQSIPTNNISITSTDCINYTLSNWDIDVFSNPQQRDLTFIDNGDNTLTIPVQQESTLPDSLATMEGFGVVDPETRQINMTITLDDFPEPNTISFILIPD
ncbi:MAG TPA: hypothetical protein VIM65_00355 [Cyclobacteriaceae bacterium]